MARCRLEEHSLPDLRGQLICTHRRYRCFAHVCCKLPEFTSAHEHHDGGVTCVWNVDLRIDKKPFPLSLSGTGHELNCNFSARHVLGRKVQLSGSFAVG